MTNKNNKSVIRRVNGIRFYNEDHTITNIIKILFLKKGRVAGGVITFQNTMLHMFNESPNFKLIVIDDQAKIRNKFLNYIYKFMQSRRIIHILFEYMYLMPQVIKYRKKVDYLFIPHPFKYGVFVILISLLLKIPFIVPILGWTEKELRLRGVSETEIFIRLKYESWVYRKAKYLLSSEDLINKYGKNLKKNKFLSFYSVVDTNIFKPMPKSAILRDKLGVGSKKVIFTAAPLEGVKAEGIKILLEAYVLIRRRYDNVILVIAGDGPDREKLEKLAKSLIIENGVMFLGYCNNMPELLNLADVFALIFSFGGGIGMAILEAIACGKPCVVSRTSGTEVLRDREEVLLTSLDPKDIADKILLLLKDEDYARKIGINARKRIEADFSIEKVGEKLFNKLSEI